MIQVDHMKATRRAFLKLFFKNAGLRSPNYEILDSDSDNAVTAAILRGLAKEINAEDTPEAAAKAKTFLTAVAKDTFYRMKLSGYDLSGVDVGQLDAPKMRFGDRMVPVFDVTMTNGVVYSAAALHGDGGVLSGSDDHVRAYVDRRLKEFDTTLRIYHTSEASFVVPMSQVFSITLCT